jgi:hypothetical protein
MKERMLLHPIHQILLESWLNACSLLQNCCNKGVATWENNHHFLSHIIGVYRSLSYCNYSMAGRKVDGRLQLRDMSGCNPELGLERYQLPTHSIPRPDLVNYSSASLHRLDAWTAT